jgi:hypothetical protein
MGWAPVISLDFYITCYDFLAHLETNVCRFDLFGLAISLSGNYNSLGAFSDKLEICVTNNLF